MDALAPSHELGRLIAGNDLRAAGEWLVAHYASDVVGLCRSMVRAKDLAEDLAQDVFANAFSNLRGYRAEASPRTWLLSIARNRCIDHLRRAHREPWIESDDETEPDRFADDAPLPAELLLRREDVARALAQLAEGERALIVLRFRHGLEYPELASVFGLREGTVRMRLSRALAKMRHELERLESEVGAPLPSAAPMLDADLEEATGNVAERQRSLPRPAAGAPAGYGAPPMARREPPPGAPPPAHVPPPAPVLAGPAPARGGVWESVRRLFGGSSEASGAGAPVSAFARALEPTEPELSESLRDRLGRLIASLPG